MIKPITVSTKTWCSMLYYHRYWHIDDVRTLSMILARLHEVYILGVINVSVTKHWHGLDKYDHHWPSVRGVFSMVREITSLYSIQFLRIDDLSVTDDAETRRDKLSVDWLSTERPIEVSSTIPLLLFHDQFTVVRGTFYCYQYASRLNESSIRKNDIEIRVILIDWFLSYRTISPSSQLHIIYKYFIRVSTYHIYYKYSKYNWT